MDLSKFQGYPHHKKVWGEEIWLVNTPLYCAKLLILNPGMQCSLHRHLVKTETFFVLEGFVDIEVGENHRRELKQIGDAVHIPVDTWHRFSHVPGVLTNNPTLILEVSSHHSDTDVERLEPSGPIS